MTIATIDDLLRYGSWEEEVAGRLHYIGRDEKLRSVIGPVRHRAKGLLSFGRKRRRGYEPPTEVIDFGPLEEYGQRLAHSLETVDFSKLGRALPPPLPPQKRKPIRDWLRRMRDLATDRFYDEEWHKAARSTAGTFLMWSFTTASFLVLVKGLAWVVTL